MSLNMSGEFILPASREDVWQKLNDPEILKACIPGCEEFTVTDDGGFRAVARVKIGPVSTTFAGNVSLLDLDPPNSYRIEGQGDGGIAGFAKGGAKVRLEAVPEGTRLVYDVDAQVGGKIAQLGSRLIQGVAKKNADDFFASFARTFQT